MNGEVIIKAVCPDDAEELLEIYAPYVLKTAITFEYQVPTAEEFRGRIASTLKKYAYIKAVLDGETVGYAYVGTFHDRPAYDWAVETTVYVKENCRKCGVGKKLYTALEQCMKEQGILNMNACIAYSETDDGHLNSNSLDFHNHMGYRTVGRFYKCGYKFSRWYDMVWAEKIIGEHMENQPPVRTFSEALPDIRKKYRICC